MTAHRSHRDGVLCRGRHCLGMADPEELLPDTDVEPPRHAASHAVTR
jgi:hypothetical protein